MVCSTGNLSSMANVARLASNMFVPVHPEVTLC